MQRSPLGFVSKRNTPTLIVDLFFKILFFLKNVKMCKTVNNNGFRASKRDRVNFLRINLKISTIFQRSLVQLCSSLHA